MENAGTDIPHLSNDELLAQARDNIERIRKSDLTVTVTDAEGRPATGVRLSINMKRHAFLFGCGMFDALQDKSVNFMRQIDAAVLERWDEFRNQAAELFNFATLPFYWGHYESHRGQTQAEQVKQLHHWCRSVGMLTKGHPLVWHEAVPDWLPDDPQELEVLMSARLADIAADFGPAGETALDFVDFLNEPTKAPEHFSNPMAYWFQKIGPAAAIALAYDRCRGFDLPRRGILNHYIRDEVFYAAARQLLDDGCGLAAIGLQSHQHSGTRPLWMFQEESDRFASLGLRVHWTENTVVSAEPRTLTRVDGKLYAGPWPSTPQGEERQARDLSEQYTLFFGHPAVDAITQWNFSDAATWLGAPAGFLDKQLRPKPSYLALHDLIRRQWWSDVELMTDSSGRAAARVFSGDYDITVRSSDGRQAANAVTVSGTMTRLLLRV